MPTYFHYAENTQLARAARLLTNKTNVILGILATPIDNEIRWFTTTALVEISGHWRASINKSLQDFMEEGWVEQITLDKIPTVTTENGNVDNERKRKLWRLSDDQIGFEMIYNQNIDGDLLDLGQYAINLEGFDKQAKYKFENSNIYRALHQLGSESILNFLNTFTDGELYYREAVDNLRNNDISCPKHEKLAKLCDVSFERIGIDLEIFKILDREFSPHKSTGAPGYTYKLTHPGIKFALRSTLDESFDPVLHTPTASSWNGSSLTASQISTVREGIVVGPIAS